ncbi:NAD(P)/FAD-dependent oxidoreductase [Candidatus Parcubacteria bacterium]|nr:NAD(P)/FAD-dependent oxidoreductase [Candidatus Parcubacteria bacterium]
MKDKYDVVIVGAGPAGLSYAEVLARNGKSVLVLEKNNKIGPKICAGGLTAKVEEENLMSLKNADNIFYSMEFHFSKTCRKLIKDKPIIVTIDRKKLGRMMMKKMLKRGAEVKIETEVKEISENSIIINEQEIKYDYLVGADGSNSTVRKFLGVKTKKMLITLQYVIPQKNQNFKKLEYFFNSKILNNCLWIFPHKDYTIVGGGYCSKTVSKKPFNFKNTFEKWLKNHQIKTDGLKLESFPINFDYQGYQFGNKFLIGDAGGFASGMTGEGIYFAMVSGKEVAKKIIDPQYDCPEISKISKIKRRHEYFFEKVNFLNNILPNLGFKIISFLLNYKWFKKIVIKVFI